MVICRLDYCNAALAGLSQATVAPLQRVQNSAARLIFKLSSPEHATPCLLQLHWLASTLAHPVQTVLHCALSFLRDVSGVSDYTSLSLLVPAVHVPSGLRSTSSTDYTLPRLRTKFTERAFSYARPTA